MISSELFVALDEEEAIEMAQWRGFLVRVVRRNSEYFPVDAEHNPFRMNLEIDAGIVTRAFQG